MKHQTSTDFHRVAKALAYLEANFRKQPKLEEVARHVGLSSAHFQRLFTRFAGISPKQFLRYLSLEHAKKLLQEQNTSLLRVTHATGLSGSSRLHDLFVTLEGMTPGEYKNGGEQLSIAYQLADTLFGRVLVASTEKGICFLGFGEKKKEMLEELQKKFPRAHYRERTTQFQQKALSFFQGKKQVIIPLHLKGTPFQLKVWQALLTIPEGKLCTYGAIAKRIKQPRASRAVGTAIGSNPVAFLIPCHRVIQASGVLGNYRWGSTRKAVMLGWESAQAEKEARKD